MISEGRPRASRLRTVLAMTAGIPLCLTSCAASSNASLQVSELRASPESDLLESPAEHVYTVTDLELLTPDDAVTSSEIVEHLEHSGYMVVQGGVITSAEFSLQLAGITEASFQLTEPAVLREEETENSPVFALGTLTLGEIEQPNTRVELVPVALDDEVAEFDVSFTAPGGLIPVDDELEGEITAHLTLAAE